MKPVIRVKSEQERVELAYALAKHRLSRMSSGVGAAFEHAPLEEEMRAIAQWICVGSPKPSTHGARQSANDERA